MTRQLTLLSHSFKIISLWTMCKVKCPLPCDLQESNGFIFNNIAPASLCRGLPWPAPAYCCQFLPVITINLSSWSPSHNLPSWSPSHSPSIYKSCEVLMFSSIFLCLWRFWFLPQYIGPLEFGFLMIRQCMIMERKSVMPTYFPCFDESHGVPTICHEQCLNACYQLFVDHSSLQSCDAKVPFTHFVTN
jgi:hypothetical protein